jgi:hypothetical protein
VGADGAQELLGSLAIALNAGFLSLAKNKHLHFINKIKLPNAMLKYHLHEDF